MSQDVVKTLRFQTYPLQQRLTVRVANGEGLDVSQFVIVQERLGTMPVKLQMSVIKTAIPVVIGYQFLAKLQPHIDWKKRCVGIWRNVKNFEVQALPAADSFRITIPTTGVMEVEFDMLSERQRGPGGDGSGVTLISSGEVPMPGDEAHDVAKDMNGVICMLPVEHNLFCKEWDGTVVHVICELGYNACPDLFHLHGVRYPEDVGVVMAVGRNEAGSSRKVAGIRDQEGGRQQQERGREQH